MKLCECGQLLAEDCQYELEDDNNKVMFVPDYLQETAEIARDRTGFWTTMTVCDYCLDVIQRAYADEIRDGWVKVPDWSEVPMEWVGTATFGDLYKHILSEEKWLDISQGDADVCDKDTVIDALLRDLIDEGAPDSHYSGLYIEDDGSILDYDKEPLYQVAEKKLFCVDGSWDQCGMEPYNSVDDFITMCHEVHEDQPDLDEWEDGTWRHGDTIILETRYA